jgi:hypothetical protein
MTDRPDSDPDSHLLDPQLLEFARRFDPARHLPDTPPVTAEQIRRNAERRQVHDREWRANPLPRPMRHTWLAAVCVAGVVGLSAFGVAVLRPHLGTGLSGTQPASPSPEASQPAGSARPAPLELSAPQGDPRQALSTLASRAAGQPPFTPAMFTFIRRQAWANGPDAPSPAIVATDIQTWLRRDLSAVEQSTPLPPQNAGAPTALWTQQLPAEIRATVTEFEPGRYQHRIPRPASQAGLLAAQIGVAYGFHVATGVAELYRLGLDPAQREAAIQVLAGIDNLAYHGTVKDRASRTGIAFTSTDPGTGVREVLIFQPDTGQLLDHEKWVAGSDGQMYVDSYTLYLDIRTTNTRP